MKKKTQQENFMVRELVKGIEELNIDETFKSVIYDFFSATMNLKSPIPSLHLAEKGKVSIDWICGPISIQAEASRNGVYHMWGKNTDGVEYEVDDYGRIVAATSLLLREMERRLKEDNPNWQEQYREFAENPYQ